MLRRTTKAVGCAAAFLLTVVGCGFRDDSGPRLAPAGGPPNDVMIGLGHVPPNALESFGGMILCVDPKGSVTLTGAEPLNPQGGMTIRQWGVRPARQTSLGALNGDLADNHFHAGQTVKGACQGEAPNAAGYTGYELAVSVSKPKGAPASMTGVRVHYVSDGHKRSFDFPVTIKLCPSSCN